MDIDGRFLETEVRLKVLSNLTNNNKILKRKLADQEVGTRLVAKDLKESNSSRMLVAFLIPPVTDGGADSWAALVGAHKEEP